MEHQLVNSRKLGNGDHLYTVNVRLCGNTLLLSKFGGESVSFLQTAEERKENFERIMRSIDPTNPNPPLATELITRDGSYLMDARLTEELGAEMFADMVESEIGDLMEQYPPLN
jgi:hypothetical protein